MFVHGRERTYQSHRWLLDPRIAFDVRTTLDLDACMMADPLAFSLLHAARLTKPPGSRGIHEVS